MSQPPVLVMGTRLLAEELTDLITDLPEWEVAGYIENLDRERCRTTLCGRPIFWIDEIASFAATHQAICGISVTSRWRFVEQVAGWHMPFATFIHPLARVSKASCVGEGSILSPGSIVASNTRIGRHVFVNRGVLIGHHTQIGDYVSLQPGVKLAGGCSVGDRTTIGIGATVIDRVSIGRDCMVAAGSVVTRNVPDNTCVAGMPARSIRRRAAAAAI